MTELQEPPDVSVQVRKRRAHRKSKAGCANCKLRRVKCDEAYPECKKCLNFGVCCNYDVRIPGLQPRCTATGGPIDQLVSVVHPTLAGGFMLEEMTDSQRLRVMTAISQGMPQSRQLPTVELHRLVSRNLFLMHFARTLTSIYERHLDSAPSRRTVEEIHYWTRGVTLFNKKLTTKLHPADRDAIWAATSIVSIITFASIEHPTPESAWPLAPTAETQPEWFRMNQGKFALWQVARPDRPDSVFHGLFENIPSIETSLENVPVVARELYDLERLPLAINPYAIPVMTIFCHEKTESSSSATVLYYVFQGFLQDEFGRLVHDKDPRALLAMAYWYSKIYTGLWWHRRRALMEGRATCIYLERHCFHERAIQSLLEEPRHRLFKGDL